MNANPTGILYSVEFEECVETFRKLSIAQIESRDSFLDTLDIDMYAADLLKVAHRLQSLSAKHAEDRFRAFKNLCAEGYAQMLFPEIYENAKEAVNQRKEVGVMVYSATEAECVLGIMDVRSFLKNN